MKDTLINAMRQEIQRLVDTHGRVSASMLIGEAIDPESPIHDCFTWENDKAAHEFRLIEARKWIRQIKVTYEKREQTLVNCRVEINEEGDYKPISVVVSEDDAFMRALEYARKRVLSSQKALKELYDEAERQHGELSPQAELSVQVVQQMDDIANKLLLASEAGHG